MSVTILMGATGSGKTELAVQFALDAADKGERACLLDIDIVNPYFRSATQSALLEACGVRVIKPNFALTTLDIPSLPAEVSTALRGDGCVIADVGGDEVGATALGPYNKDISGDARILFVVNVYRPLSETADKVCALMERLQDCARVRATGLINNANIGARTTIEEVLNGQEVLEAVSARLGVPITFITGYQDILAQLPNELKHMAYPLQTRLRPEWL